jgi:glucose/mannose-6-phosphate isomerase
MANINSLEEIKRIDKEDIYASIDAFPRQIEQAWKEINKIELPDSFKEVSNIVVCGMGGSALGGRIIDSLLTEKVRVPIEIFTEAKLPFYVNEHTLVVLSSYSGNTEETLQSANEALNKKAKIFGIASGGKLAEFLNKHKLPSYIYDPVANTSKQPRMGLGYPIIGLLGILAKYYFIHITDQEIKDSIILIRKNISEMGTENLCPTNEAILLANHLHWKMPVIIASEHLVGAAHTFKNQLNENAKTFVSLFDLPEANHHLMEGLKNPAEGVKNLYFLFLESDLYSEFIKKRYPVTLDVVEKNGIEVGVYKLTSKTKLEQIFELITLGLLVSFYLAILYDVNPTPIPWVDYFKKKLS